MIFLILITLPGIISGLGKQYSSYNDFQEVIAFPNEVFQYENNYSLPVPDMIRSYGYVCEVHSYQTEDGYINTLHRILPKGPSKNQSVFVQHGLLGTSADFVMGRPDKTLGYVLANNGYDVWLGNARGNLYSKTHVNLTEDDNAFWRFSFDEMGKYDLPAALKYVQKTQPNNYSSKLFYIGHSMGTTMFWVAVNEHKKFMEENLHAMIAIGPVAYVGQVKSPIALLAPLSHEFQILFRLLGIREFSPSNRITQLFDKYVCDETMRELELCENFVFLLTGFDKAQMNMTLLPIILGHEPGGTATQTVIHFAQLVDSKKFRKFDYGRYENMKRYHQKTPPEYSLDKIELPVMLIWADNDWLADPKDVARIKLPNLIESYEVPMKNFNHVDFIWGLDADRLVYPKILKTLDSYH